MPPPTDDNDSANGRPPSERSPLLGQQKQTSPHGEPEAHEEDAPDEAPTVETPPNPKLAVIMGSLYLGGFVAAMDLTIIATLSGPISASFDSFTLLAWVATGYIIANAAIQPISGKLTDIYGRRAGLVFAFTFFSAGTLICGLAQTSWVIIFGRVVAGMGGGCINTITTFVASDLIPLRRRGVWQGIANIAWGLGAALGGFFGGAISDTLGWRWAFLIQVPVIVVAGLVACFVVSIPIKESDKSRIRRVDFLGSILLVSSLVLLLIALNSGGNVVPWKHPLVYISLPLAVILFALFIYIEDRVVPEPVIPVRLMLDRTVAAASLTNWFISMAAFAIMYYVPIYFQARGSNATQAGTRLIPNAIGASVGSLGSGLIMKATGKYWWLGTVSQALIIVGTALIWGVFGRDTSTWPPFVFLFLLGIGYGAMLTITLLALISAVDHKFQAIITSVSYAFRSTGSTLGITIAGAVFQNILKAQLEDRFGNEKNGADEIRRIRNNLDEIKHLPPGWKDGVLDSYMAAFDSVWAVTLGLAVLGGLASLFMREHTLHNNIERRQSSA